MVFDILSRYFWLLAIIENGWRYIAQERTAARSGAMSLRTSDEAKSLRRWFAVFHAHPWIIMGIATILGGTPNFSYYFRPQDHNPYVLTWYGVQFCSAIGFTFWAFFYNGAEKIIKYQIGVAFVPRYSWVNTVGRVKFFAALAPIWIVLTMVVATSIDVRLYK
ncbi:hypothetical protein BWP39_21210 [Paraburkholderia acidicola]|uniref:Uncharacterized protein n=2 Tax=Paraburkholderia acidicola TaxID=1912599 RepID=A0A2A4EPW6_9BURK|nr:hypothetical protein BWP39_21210 [Paraburkholderia acidicola]